jgi:hypothetical protein
VVLSRAARLKKRRLRRRRIAVSAVAAVIALGGILLWVILREMERHVFSEPTYHHDVGQRFAHGIGTTVVRSDKGITLTDERSVFPQGSIPVFYEERPAMFLTDDMALITPEVNRAGRAGYFSEIAQNAEGGYTLSYGKTKAAFEDGFLFDGKNLYVFLERAEIVWGEGEDERITLEPFSHMVVIYNLRVEIYPRGADDGLLINTELARVMAYFKNYSIDLSKDIFYMDGQEMLLFSDPKMLAPYGKGGAIEAK